VKFCLDIGYKHAHILCIKHRLTKYVMIMVKIQNIADKCDRLYICNCGIKYSQNKINPQYQTCKTKHIHNRKVSFVSQFDIP
jgi:hypothetical protein